MFVIACEGCSERTDRSRGWVWWGIWMCEVLDYVLGSSYQRYRSWSIISRVLLMRSRCIFEVAFCCGVPCLHDGWCFRDPFDSDDRYVIYHPLLSLYFCCSHPLFFIACFIRIQYIGDVCLEDLDACLALWCGCCDLCFFGEFVC